MADVTWTPSNDAASIPISDRSSRDWLQMNRRDFLAALGAAYGSAACAWAAPRSRFIDYATGEDAPKIERFVNTLCPMCPGGCGLNVRVVHGCAVGISGNPSHPINRGGLCSRASATLQDLYNPDRIHHPLKRVGPRGSGQWTRIDWEEAIATIADRLQAVRAGSGPQGLCVVLGQDRGITRVAWERFTRAYGTPNLIDASTEDNLGVLPAVLATHGVRQRLGYDLAKSNYVLSFSSGWLDAHWSTEQAARAFSDFRRGRPGFRPRWVHVEPRFSLTAIKADEWLPIRPGSEGTVALGIAHVLIREGLYEREFVARHGYGFEDWADKATTSEQNERQEGGKHLGFRRMVLQDYTPAKVQAATGVPVGTLFRLGREFGTKRPAVALGFDGGGCSTQGTYTRMAIHCLNALVGSIDVPGGVTVFQELSLLQGESSSQESDGIDAIARRGLGQPRLDGPVVKRRLADHAVDLLADSIIEKKPYATEALVLVDSDPAFSLAEGSRFATALEAVPFVAAFSGYKNDSNRYADLILPMLHGLHRWDFNTAHTLKGHSVATISLPVLQPLKGMKDPYDALLAVSRKLGGSVAKALPWASAREAVDAVCHELFEGGKGAAFGPENEESWAQLLERRGWRAPFAAKYEDFKRDVLAGGGWTDPIYFHQEWDRVFRSPSRRFAFSSPYLARSFEIFPDSGDASAEGGEDRRCLPDCGSAPHEPSEGHPLDLYVYTLPNLVSVASPNLPWLNDIAGAYMFEKWRTWVEIHPETAERLGVSDGQLVIVETVRGKLTLPARHYKGLMPEVIAIPYGFGRQTGGRWCEGIGHNPAVLIDSQIDPLSGKVLWHSTRASIQKA